MNECAQLRGPSSRDPRCSCAALMEQAAPVRVPRLALQRSARDAGNPAQIRKRAQPRGPSQSTLYDHAGGVFSGSRQGRVVRQREPASEVVTQREGATMMRDAHRLRQKQKHGHYPRNHQHLPGSHRSSRKPHASQPRWKEPYHDDQQRLAISARGSHDATIMMDDTTKMVNSARFQRPAPPRSHARMQRSRAMPQYGNAQAKGRNQPQEESWQRRILSGPEALKACPELLADFELDEVATVEKIYYIGTQTSKVARMGQACFDTSEGEYIPAKGEHLDYRFELQDKLGRGSFGQVFRCRDHKGPDKSAMVAVKMVRSAPRFRKQALVELRVLRSIRERDPRGASRVIVLQEHFWFRKHLCLVFPMYSINLYEVLRANGHRGFAERTVFNIAKQLLGALSFLRDANIMHCDIKPENILLEQGPERPAMGGPGRGPYDAEMSLADGTQLRSSNIRLVDLGSACFVGEQVHSYIQSRFYRAPEVILGAPTGLAVDMWSCGCVLAETLVGVPLFPGQDELEQLALIVAIRGQPSREGAKRWATFFHQGSGAPRWTQNPKFPKPGSLSLRRALAASSSSNETLFEVVCKCLVYDPETRIHPEDALARLARFPSSPR